ncbi:MAG: radical SAM protein [candidate division WOR-3 bacterium]|nr:MAG: radical SAM protein [candidate division WOR-3 bacterium]
MQCRSCGSEATISRAMPYCPVCIRERFDELRPAIDEAHERARSSFHLPARIPAEAGGVKCSLCVNECSIGEGGSGYCGVRRNIAGSIDGPDGDWAYVDWYYDPLPTNCVADWVCRGSKDHGYKNLAVFYGACTFDCLFCQNWHFRERKNKASVEDLVKAVDSLTGCVCYFGGDPTPFALHSLEASRLMSERRRKPRICWETNGSVAPAYMEKWLAFALASDGCIKIDFKTFNENLNIALCGASNRNTKENIRQVAECIEQREEPPVLIVNTLIIPGYIDEQELESMAKFIGSINKKIPWSFLAFYPHFRFDDMPCTSRKQAEMALSIAADYEIKNTHLGNVHLLR